jgi:hypothetical protein
MLVTAAPVACGTGKAGTVRAHWTGIDTALGSGDLRLPMRATWCASRGRLTLLGFAGVPIAPDSVHCESPAPPPPSPAAAPDSGVT